MRNEYRTMLAPPVDWPSEPPAEFGNSSKPSYQGSASSEIQTKRAIKDILVPTDFSPSSAQALEKAVALARQCGAAVTLLHVVDVNLHTPSTGPANAAKLAEKLEREGRERLDEAVQNLPNERVELHTLIEEGLPCERICDAARQSDLVVIGKGKPKPFWHLFSRRTAQAVLDKAPCPVLVIRAGT